MTDAPPQSVKAKAKRFTFGRLIDDFIILSSGQFMSKIFGFVAFAWLARALTADQYGAVETAVGLAAIGAIALEMGTGAVGVRHIAQSNGRPAEILGDVILVRFFLAVLVAPALAIFYISVTKTDAPDALFWLYAASLFAIPFNHNWFFQAHEKMGVAGFGQTVKMAVFLVAVFLVAPQKHGVTYVAVAELAAAFALVLWFATFCYFQIRPELPTFEIRRGIRFFRESSQLGASSFVNALAQNLPVLVVASVASGAEAANIGVAQRLMVSLMTFSYVYYFNLFPLVARRLVDDHDALGKIVFASEKVTAWAGVVAASLLWSVAPQVMSLIFGAKFEAAGLAFGFLAWSGAIVLASGNARWLLVAGKRQGSLLAAQLVYAGLILCIGFLLAPAQGGEGAAVACLVGATGLWIVAHARTAGLPVRPPLTANIIPALTAAAVLITLTTIDGEPLLRAGVTVLLLGAGVLADRKFPGALKTLVDAKSAT
jgi:O-antigen/teichoic acid export membrane protein